MSKGRLISLEARTVPLTIKPHGEAGADRECMYAITDHHNLVDIYNMEDTGQIYG